MKIRDRYAFRYGYTIIELMVTIIIVAALVASIGVFFVKLLTIQEREREDAYIREKLADICAIYADFVSIGSTLSTSTNFINQRTEVMYRHETGGVSLETGTVTRAAYLRTHVNAIHEGSGFHGLDGKNGLLDLNIYSFVSGEQSKKMNGNADLLPLLGDVVSCTVTPLNYTTSMLETNGYQTTDAALGWLEVSVKYEFKNDNGEYVETNAIAGRLVRLWNR